MLTLLEVIFYYFMFSTLLDAYTSDPYSISTPSQKLCCYYRQHYHDAYCGNKSCVLSEALVTGAPNIVCSTVSKGCMPGMRVQDGIGQGYWLEGWKYNCNECNSPSSLKMK